MKHIFKFLTLILIVIVSTITLTSCSFFGDEDDILQIKEILTTELETGDIKVTINYMDEEQPSTEFIIPRGAEGIKGTGIKEVLTEKLEEENLTLITITYTDDTLDPTTFEVKDGVSLAKIDSTVDEETGETIVTVYFSDGTTSEPIIIPQGKPGKDGISIIGIEQLINRDYSVTLTFKMSEGDDVFVEIPAPIQGEDGRGISEIVSIPSGDKYIMMITYTDDSVQELEFARPNKWFSELSTPSQEDGLNGDLWYDIAHNVIYVKQSNRWIKTIDLNKITNEQYEIRFDVNDSEDSPASMPQGSLLTYQIDAGTYFSASGYEIPFPTRDGYVFKGWYTTKNPTVINGMFTDLTPVFSNLTLYANWEKID